jgi:hypothetical protein
VEIRRQADPGIAGPEDRIVGGIYDIGRKCQSDAAAGDRSPYR